jgi:hypothetical protein
MNYKLWGTVISAGTLGLTVICLAFYVGDRTATPLNIAVIVIGYAFGWLLGIVTSPYTTKESDRFTKYSGAVAVFASGYLVSKADKALETLVDPAFILESVHGFRAISFATALVLGLIVTFAFREYAD